MAPHETSASLTFHLLDLHQPLLTGSGLPEAVATELLQTLPPRLQTALAAGAAGQPAQVWALSQELFVAATHVCAQALHRADGDWPRRRRALAEQLLGRAGLAALRAEHPGADPENLIQLVGRLGQVLLATAGQYSAAIELTPDELCAWLLKQAPAPANAPAWASELPETLPKPVGPRSTSRGARHPTPPAKLASPATKLVVAETQPWSAKPAVGPGWRRVLSKWWAVVVLVAGLGSYCLVRAAGSGNTAATTRRVAILVPTAAATTPDAPVAAPAPAPEEAAAPSPVTVKHVALRPATKVHQQVRSKVMKIKALSKIRPGKATRLAKGRALELVPAGDPLYQRLNQPDPNNHQMVDLDQLTFAEGQATLDAAGVKRLQKVAAVLRKFPDNRLIVFGNAASAEPQPLTLALVRAQAVVQELVKQGVSKKALQAQGRMRPVATAATDPGSNRRIAFYISQPPPSE